MSKGTKIAGITGGTTTALGGVAAAAGVILCPLTLGASLALTVVGVGMAAAGGVTATEPGANYSVMIAPAMMGLPGHRIHNLVIPPTSSAGSVLSLSRLFFCVLVNQCSSFSFSFFKSDPLVPRGLTPVSFKDCFYSERGAGRKCCVFMR